MKIGIFGGSFNPVHNTHLEIINLVLKKNLIDEIWLVPCKKHPLDKKLASPNFRLAMIKTALKQTKKLSETMKKRIKILDIEIKSKGKSYTLRTIRKLKARYPKNKFYLLVGSDIFYEIKKWHLYKQLLKEIEFIAVKRKGYQIKKVKGMQVIAVLKEKESGISSTSIRKRIKNRQSIRNFVPPAVKRYITEKKLYSQ